MAQKNKSLPKPDEPRLDDFARQVEIALKYFDDVMWLGNHSPLAAPYFLGSALVGQTVTEQTKAQGQALQQALKRSAEALDTEDRNLLEIAFFQRKTNLDGEGMALELHMARRSFYRNRTEAIQKLANVLNRQQQPPLRLESPIRADLVGRGKILHVAPHVLNNGKSLYLHGVSGIGKTSVAIAIAHHWQTNLLERRGSEGNTPKQQVRHYFWYTIRPSFNDHLSSLVFALAYFLHNLDASHTWRQLIADKGHVQVERTLGLLRYDMATLAGKVLICIDEVDLLQVERQEHTPLLHLIEELRTLTPLLLIGQRIVIATDEQIKVDGLDENSLIELLTRANIPLPTAPLRQQLLAETKGNPALLTLIIALLLDADEVETLLISIANLASFEALFTRIWRRLSENERLCVMQLAVYRNAAPIDSFAGHQPMINHLLQRGLLQLDGYGGIYLLPHIREMAYRQIPNELKQRLHLHAMAVRAERAQIIPALYHAIQAEAYAQAVWLWFNQRSLEIERGQGAAALPLLTTIDPAQLPHEQDRTALQIARGELFSLTGRAEAAEKELIQLQGMPKGAAYAFVQQLLGDALEKQGRIEQALDQYRAALDTLAGPMDLRAISVHTRISFLHAYRAGNLKEAHKEAIRARVRAEMFHGQIEERLGNYHAAQVRYEAALALIDQVDDAYGERATLYFYFGNLQLKTGNLDTAIDLLLKAIEGHQKRGDTVSPLYNQMTLAYAYLKAGKWEESYHQAISSLAIAEQMKHGYLISGLSAGVGEACVALGRFQEAEYYAMQSLNQEEEFFRPSALILLGQVNGAQKKVIEAEKFFRQAIKSAQELDDSYMEADAWRKLGDMYHASNQPASVRDAYQSAVNLYTQLGLHKEIDEIKALV